MCKLEKKTTFADEDQTTKKIKKNRKQSTTLQILLENSFINKWRG